MKKKILPFEVFSCRVVKERNVIYHEIIWILLGLISVRNTNIGERNPFMRVSKDEIYMFRFLDKNREGW